MTHSLQVMLSGGTTIQPRLSPEPTVLYTRIFMDETHLLFHQLRHQTLPTCPRISVTQASHRACHRSIFTEGMSLPLLSFANTVSSTRSYTFAESPGKFILQDLAQTLPCPDQPNPNLNFTRKKPIAQEKAVIAAFP